MMVLLDMDHWMFVLTLYPAISMCMFSELARDYKQLCGLRGYLCSNKVTHRLCFCNKLTAKKRDIVERAYYKIWVSICYCLLKERSIHTV